MLARGESRKPCSHPAGGVPCRQAPAYRAHSPKDNALSRIVQNNLSEFEQSLRNPPDSRRPRPHPSIITALEKLVECGVMRFGAVRFRCPDCGHDVFVAFSCKRRGLCPTCDAKRAAIIAADASDRLLPPIPYRQWVLVIPKRLRWYINQHPDLAGELSRVFAGEINRFLRKNADGAPAQLHFIQRFGGALNLHIHVHAVVSDGVFSIKPGFAAGGNYVLRRFPAPPRTSLPTLSPLSAGNLSGGCAG